MNNSVHNDLIHLLQQCADEISKKILDELVNKGVSEFKLKLANSSSKNFTQQQLPVLTELGGIVESSYTFNFQQIAADLKWRPSPRADFDAKVMALCSINEMLDLGDVVAGLMFMTPNQIYPEHQHAPQEVYFVLSGNASWLYGGNVEYRLQQPGDIIYNHPRDLHGMKTQNESLLALYFLWGDKTKGYSY